MDDQEVQERITAMEDTAHEEAEFLKPRGDHNLILVSTTSVPLMRARRKHSTSLE